METMTFDFEDMIEFANWSRQFNGTVVFDEAALEQYLNEKQQNLLAGQSHCFEPYPMYNVAV